jgi:hypothetical protein
MPATVTAAYPYIEVNIDTSALQPVAQRSPGVIAIVGSSDTGAAAVGEVHEVDTIDDAAELFASTDPATHQLIPTTLYNSLAIALLQDPKPSKIYGIKVAGTAYATGLSALEGVDDVTFVALANEPTVGTATAGANPATDLHALKEHVEEMSAGGQKRIGVAMIDPTVAKSANYVTTITSAAEELRSDSSRMVLVAARGASGDVATAAMAAIAGFDPQISIVLKRIRGIEIPTGQAYGPAEIKQLSEDGINPVISPSLIVGGGLYFADGRTFTSDDSTLFVDIVRVLDDIDFRLKAGLIGAIGDARITKAGMTLVKARTEGILGPLQRNAEIDDFDVRIPVLDILNVPTSTWNATDQAVVTTARANRAVDMIVTVTYGPAVHRLLVTLAPKF